jgi:hypothetical protein
LWQLKNLRRRRKTEEEEEEEEEAKKKIDFHSLCKERGGGAAELRQKQTNASHRSVAFREHTQSIHSIDFPTLGNNSNVNFHRYRRTLVRI